MEVCDLLDNILEEESRAAQGQDQEAVVDDALVLVKPWGPGEEGVPRSVDTGCREGRSEGDDRGRLAKWMLEWLV